MVLRQTSNTNRMDYRCCTGLDAFHSNLAPKPQFQESRKAKHELEDWKFVLWAENRLEVGNPCVFTYFTDQTTSVCRNDVSADRAAKHLSTFVYLPASVVSNLH